MLRISLIASPDEGVSLRLEGQVRGPWVEELRRACAQVRATGRGLRLDLTGVSFMDLDGVALCRSLRDQYVALLHGSPFVAEQLKGGEVMRPLCATESPSQAAGNDLSGTHTSEGEQDGRRGQRGRDPAP